MYTGKKTKKINHNEFEVIFYYEKVEANHFYFLIFLMEELENYQCFNEVI